jgi:AbrB family transcriptional regulator, stage V sporulation protein T
MIAVKMSQGGRVVIPVELREKLNIHQGDEIVFEERDGELIMSSKRQRLKKIQDECFRLLSVVEGVSHVDEFIAERRAEAQKEEAETKEWLDAIQKSRT